MVSRKIRRSFVGLALMACFSLCTVFSGAQNIQTSIDKKDILIGEQVNYTLRFTLPNNGFQVAFNLPDSFPHFDILEKVKSDSVDPAGNYLVTQRVLFTSFDSGRWYIPSFPARILNGSSSYTLNTDSVLINVGYAPADSTGQLRDIKPVMEVFIFDRTWIYIGIGALVAIILAIVLYRYFKNRPKKTKPLFTSPLTPYEEAMQSLRKLQAYDLSVPPAVKEYYTALSTIFRHYYSRKQQQHLLNKTTGELLLRLKEQDIHPDVLSAIATALRSADAVKFAKYLPDLYESKNSLEQVRGVIEQLEKHQSINH